MVTMIHQSTGHRFEYTVLIKWDAVVPWRRGVAVITTTHLHSTKPELRFCAGSNTAHGVSEIRDGEYLWQWYRLEVRLNAFRGSNISQNNSSSLYFSSSLSPLVAPQSWNSWTLSRERGHKVLAFFKTACRAWNH